MCLTVLSLCVSVSYFGIGLVRGYSASAVPSINQKVPELLPSEEITSWASSIPPFGAFFGSLVAGPLLHLIGRKSTVLLVSPLWLVAWILIATASQWPYMVLGRFMSGFGAGLTLPTAQIYVSECSDPKTRGVIGSFPSIFMSAGVLLSYIIGYYLPWDLLAWCSSACPIVLLLAVSFLPESPVWYRSKNKVKSAENSYKWLKLKHNPIYPPTDVIDIKTIDQKISPPIGNENQEKTKLSEYFTRPIIMPLLIGLAVLALQQLSGIDAIIFFTVEVFKKSGSSLDGNLSSVIVGAVQLFSNILSLFIVDKAGRKVLLIISGIIMTISNASMGAAYYLNDIGNTNYGFLPLVSLIVFMVGYSIGFGCIPYLLLGEIFPQKQRSTLGSIAGSFNLGVMFIVIKTYHPLEKTITTAGTFWLYAGLCAFAVLFVIVFVPETKGVALEDISRLFLKADKQDKQNRKMSQNETKNLSNDLDVEITKM